MGGNRQRDLSILCDCKIIFLLMLCVAIIVGGVMVMFVAITCTDSLGFSVTNGTVSCTERLTGSDSVFSPSYSKFEPKPNNAEHHPAQTVTKIMKAMLIAIIMLIMLAFTVVAIYKVAQRKLREMDDNRNSNLTENLKAAFDDSINTPDDKKKLLNCEQQMV